MIDRARVERGATAARVSAVAGAVGLVAIVLFFTVGGPFGTINDVAGLVMIGSLAFVMLAHYELGGIVPLWPARLSLGGAMLVVVGWAVLQVGFILGWLNVADVQQAATGGWAVQAVLLGFIGLWIAGASLLAGPWLPPLVRTLGIVTGAGLVVMAIGLIQGGYSSLWANVGGSGFQIVLPVWAFLLGRVFGARAAAAATAAPAPAASAPGPAAA
ncbi:MAG TPA: hypothetical protein VGI98_05160 [Candidatus Limnocylindrales bacterium]